MLGMVSYPPFFGFTLQFHPFPTISGFVVQFWEVLNVYEIGTWQPGSVSCGRLADLSLLPTRRRTSRRTRSRRCGWEAGYILRSGMRSFSLSWSVTHNTEANDGGRPAGDGATETGREAQERVVREVWKRVRHLDYSRPGA